MSERRRCYDRVAMKVIELKHQMDTRFADVHTKMDAGFSDMQARISTEGEVTRRHFDVVAEQLTSEIAILATAVVSLTRSHEDNRGGHITMISALNDHEVRLLVLERQGR